VTTGAGVLRTALVADLGRIEEADGGYALARAHYRDALAQDDRTLDLYRRFAASSRKAGRLDEAEAGLEAALRLVPSDPYTHLEMARVLEARGDSAGAVEHLGSALLAWEIVSARPRGPRYAGRTQRLGSARLTTGL